GSAAREPRPPVGAQDWSVSLQGFLENRLVQFRLGQELLEALVFLFEFLQASCLFGLHAAVLLAPAMQRLLADAQGLANLADSSAGRQHAIRVAQLGDDLRGAMSRPFHRESSMANTA